MDRAGLRACQGIRAGLGHIRPALFLQGVSKTS